VLELGPEARERAAQAGYPLPRLYTGVVSADEARHVREVAMPLLQPSKVDSAEQLAGTNRATRSSYSAELPHQARTDDAVLRAIGERVAELTGLPVENQEPIQVVRYRPGEEFKPHFDAAAPGEEPAAVTALIGARRFTALLYLNDSSDGFRGGSTSFPALETGAAVAPSLGSALVFANLDPVEGGPGAKPHPLSLHAGERVEGVEGNETGEGMAEKLVANVWVRERAYLPKPGMQYAAAALYLAFWAAALSATAVYIKPSWLIPH